MDRVAGELLNWLTKHQINPDKVRVEIYCADHETQIGIERAVMGMSHPNQWTLSTGGSMRPFQRDWWGINFTWTNPDKWDTRKRPRFKLEGRIY